MTRPHGYALLSLPAMSVTISASLFQRVAQSRIDQFAECSGDDQWIHVDVERARNSRSATRSRTDCCCCR